MYNNSKHTQRDAPARSGKMTSPQPHKILAGNGVRVHASGADLLSEFFLTWILLLPSPVRQ